MLAILLMVAQVIGQVKVDGGVLPGCTVRITSGAFRAQAISDANGIYRFDRIPLGYADLSFSLDGLEPSQSHLKVVAGMNRAADVELKFKATEEVITIYEPPCGEEDSPWLVATCRDYDFDSALIDAVNANDRSAAALLRQRYESARSLYEKNRIAGALLHHLPDDAEIWRALDADAANAVRFVHEDNPDLKQLCQERGFDPADFLGVAISALAVAGEDPRSRPLLTKALATDDGVLVGIAVFCLAEQGDINALPEIKAAIDRLESKNEVAMYLARFNSEEADRLAFTYLADSDRERYYELQRGR